MILLVLLKTFVISLIGYISFFTAKQQVDLAEWGYDDETGPRKWSELDSAYAPCDAGCAQSPINLTKPTIKNIQAIQFNYKTAPLAIHNNGRTIMVDYESGSWIMYNGMRYDLQQFHFHHHSEHSIDGEFSAMEIHFVHQNADTGQFTVIGIMLEVGEDDNESYAPIFNNLPEQPILPDANTNVHINAFDLMPENTHSFYTYDGSLTTPPCSETVYWVVMATPIRISSRQVTRFAAIFHNNFRPIQPLNDRQLFKTVD